MWFRRSAVEWILVRVWKEREIREQKAGALPDREDSDRETWSFRPSFVPWQKTQLRIISQSVPLFKTKRESRMKNPRTYVSWNSVCESKMTLIFFFFWGGGGWRGEMENCAYLRKNPGYAPDQDGNLSTVNNKRVVPISSNLPSQMGSWQDRKKAIKSDYSLFICKSVHFFFGKILLNIYVQKWSPSPVLLCTT